MAYIKCLRNVISSTIPDGKTVTPTDVVATWLACGSRTEEYTTLSAVLADSTCLNALMASDNAVDYLARSTTFASDITSDSGAMTAIGLNNYCANTLLSDSDWCEAICNSTYFESVLNVKVPVMTSNTTPSGECFADSNNNTAYYPFDDVVSTTYVSVNGTKEGKVWYQFTQSVKISMCETKLKGTGSTRVPYGKFISSNDGVTFNDITAEELAPVENYKRILTTPVEATCFGVNVRETSSANNFAIVMLQFYGRADV